MSASASTTSLTLTGLKALTTYEVVVTACRNEACTQSSAATGVSAETDTEYWQFRGSGNSVNDVDATVADGNARLSATGLVRMPATWPTGCSFITVQWSQPVDARRGVASGAADTAIPDSYLS